VDPGRWRSARREQQVRSVAVGDDLQELRDALIHDARQCTVCIVALGQVLIVSADERWLRVLEVTIRLGGAETISRRSVGDALRSPIVEGQQPTEIIVDLAAQTTPDELEDVRGLVKDNALPAVVILPEGLEAERERFADVGATVLVRPYRPSELYAALWPGRATPLAETGDEKPLTVNSEAAAEPAAPDQGEG
jgi:hypothetical protein